jgi:RHS repeat-associated protein
VVVCNTGPSYPSQCAGTGNDTLYKNKLRRYPEYVNGDAVIDNASNPEQNSLENEQAILDQCHANCEAEADYWMNVLSRCHPGSSDSISLRAALIDICSKGCSINNPYGVSSIPSSITATYHSFEEAIVGILGSGAINDSCTAELLSNPYPYNRLPVEVDRVIIETDIDICGKISLHKQAYLSSGFSGSFHQYLQNNFGGAYGLDSTELDDLLNSCSNCNGILKDDIVLPLLFDPQSSPCLHCDSLQVALAAFHSKFPTLDTLGDDYEILFANFFNHRFGFSLIYDKYKTFLDSCTANSSYTGWLCNQPAVAEVEADDNSCIMELFATALTNANNTYIAYIDSVHRDFRSAWLTKCMNVQPILNMKANLYEYHYTLYYYDQSGNLVKTVPPEGVDLLSANEIDTVKYGRLLKNEGCYQFSDSILLNNNGQIAWANASGFEANPFTAEMIINFTSHADQVIISKLLETSFFADSIQRQLGFVVKIESNKLAVTLYGIDDSLSQQSTAAVSVRNISDMIPLSSWTHLAIQRTADINNPLALFINGQQIAISYTSNTIAQATTQLGDSLMVGSFHAAHLTLPGKLRGAIKNLRIYNRLLSADEMRQNAFNVCQLPTQQSGLIFWSAMNNATNNNVRDFISQKDGRLTDITWQLYTPLVPTHRLVTTYQYNSFNQVLQQYSPDGDTSQFFYDRLGRLIVSQNKEQKENASYSGAANRFSYTQYDAQGRITEVGEKSNPSSDISNINLLDTSNVKNWLASGTNRQITKTIYDNPINLYQSAGASRKRVVASIYVENADDTEGDSTLYSYDINGNVKTYVQHIKALVAVDATNGKKRVDYDYDLVSGKVNMVSYQPDKGDQFFYKYQYDADSRITRSFSSRDKLIWTEDASYNYYLHGPLARIELGQYKVQGIDYAYTLQGWLKGINSDSLDANYDIGNDGKSGAMFGRVSRDVYGFKLGYFDNDYTAIGGTATAFANKNYQKPVSFENTGNQLFNGNISYTNLALSKINAGATTGYSYGYDQLNRLTEMRQHTTGNSSTWSNSNIITAYRESIAYDANGNILKYLRKGTAATPDMDSMNYQYNRDVSGNLVNNKLSYVKDQVNSNNYPTDIDNQSSNNYLYDRIGNLKTDVAEGINTIDWTVYGKIKKIDKGSGSNLLYGYDATGNRTIKKVSGAADTTTFYVRDAQGNVLAVYSKKGTDNLKWNEQHLYGSSRLGMWNADTTVPAAPPVVINNAIYDGMMLGSRTYELSNHLGNVLATISDKKIGNDSSGVVNYYLAEVLSQNDYYPFGMLMPGRKYNAGSGYRYGFNGKENDNEIKGEGDQQDYGMRIYDPRLGRFLSVDPITKKYPELTPYQFASNRAIDGVDLDGLEYKSAADWAQQNLANYTIHWDALSTVPSSFNTLKRSNWRNVINNVLFCAQSTSLVYAQGNSKVAEYLKAHHFESNRIGNTSGQFVAFTKYKTAYQFLIKPVEYNKADRGDLIFLQDPRSSEQNSGHVAILSSAIRDKGGNGFTVNVYTTNASYSENDETKHNNFGEAIYFFEKNDQGKIELSGKWQKNMDTGDWHFKDMKSEHLELQGFGRVDEEKIKNQPKKNAKKK